MNTILQTQLLSHADPDYKAFQCRLMPTVPPERVMGVRTPALRKMAKEFQKTAEAEGFLMSLPHDYYEENNLHAALICAMTDYRACVDAVNAFLPYVDNWATCDMMTPTVFSRHRGELVDEITRWMASEHTYAMRFGIKTLMQFYLEDAFDPIYPQWVAAIRSEDYYVNMMVAWYFATALAKQPDAILPYLEEGRLTPWIHAKTIQKAVESFRISAEQKAYLKTLKKRKNG